MIKKLYIIKTELYGIKKPCYVNSSKETCVVDDVSVADDLGIPFKEYEKLLKMYDSEFDEEHEYWFTKKRTAEYFLKHLDSEINFLKNPIPEDKGFTIICNNCSSTNCSHQEELGCDYEDNSYISGYYLICNDCGQSER